MLVSMQTAGGKQMVDDDTFESVLRQSLYRFDCPDAHTLGEYELDVLGASERTRIASHAVDCAECTAELAVLRAFLATPTRVPEPFVERARRIVATLLTPRPGLAYGGLRGAGDTSMRIYEADDVSVTLGPGSTRGGLLGLVVTGDVEPAALGGREVRAVPGEGSVVRARLDDLGNFELDNLSPGAYALEIDLPHGVLVIEELRVG